MLYRLLLANGLRSNSLYADIIKICGLVLFSFLIGLFINEIRPSPLSFIYQTKADRVYSSTEKLNSLSSISELPLGSEKRLSLVEFRVLVTQHLGTVLDARPSFFYRSAHVPGALSLPRDDFQESYTKLASYLENDKSAAIAVYCTGGGCEDSSIVQQALLKMGYNNVSVFLGGWDEWIATGLPQEKGQ
jgi:rhodanese-related sulfurtransferase